MTVGVAVGDALRRLRLIRQDTEHAGTVSFVPLGIVGDGLHRPGSVWFPNEDAKRPAGGGLSSAWIPAATRIEAGRCLAFIEHQYNRDTLLRVFPGRGILDFPDELVDVDVTAINESVSIAIAGR